VLHQILSEMGQLPTQNGRQSRGDDVLLLAHREIGYFMIKCLVNQDGSVCKRSYDVVSMLWPSLEAENVRTGAKIWEKWIKHERRTILCCGYCSKVSSRSFPIEYCLVGMILTSSCCCEEAEASEAILFYREAKRPIVGSKWTVSIN